MNIRYKLKSIKYATTRIDELKVLVDSISPSIFLQCYLKEMFIITLSARPAP